MSVNVIGTITVALAAIAIMAAWFHDGARDARTRRDARVVFWVATWLFWPSVCVLVVVSHL